MKKPPIASFPVAYADCESLLEGRLTRHTRTDAHRILDDHWHRPEAWVLWHQVICLTGGARHESGGVIDDAKRRFAEHLTPDMQLTMLFDSAIGLVRDSAMSGGNTELAQLALDRILIAESITPYGMDWAARLAYVQGRALYELGRMEDAYIRHQVAADIWVHTVSDITQLWVDRNEVFRIRVAVALGLDDEAQALSHNLSRQNPTLYKSHGKLLVGRRGHRHFNEMDIRW